MQLDQVINNNLPLANLYTYTLEKLLNKYNVNIDNAIPHRELHHIISQPFQVGVEQLTASMNDRLRADLLDSVGYPNNKHPQMLSKLERDKILLKLEKSLRLSGNHEIFMGNPWSISEVEHGLKLSIKEILECSRIN
ncbi:hypothetical protein Q2T41_11490 [Maribacter confluentis]|uniref:Uncharacterized protein n=1 Tax=Maribacter confluentis TaxID=1656093 RepID=A0ABT8RQY2_9FLAO|nr:hypothetical protein [Maribacter confluentis]MDO1513279.1 hypothetical protein [Maribacter confluentis]